MNQLTFFIFVSCAVFGSVRGILEEEREQIFAEDGDSRMKPAKTLQNLRKLSIAYGRDECSGCDKMKREVDRLIAASEATEDRCTQKSVDHINKLLRVYFKSKLNLVPFLNYYKKKLIELCEDQFDVTNLRWESLNSGFWDDDFKSDDDHTSKVDTRNGKSMDTVNREDSLKNTINEREKQMKLKKEREQQYSQNLESHREANEDWVRRYNGILYDKAYHKEPRQLLDALLDLDKSRLTTFGLSDSVRTKQTLADLISLRYFSVFSCNRKQFNFFKTLMAQFELGYNPSIKNYIAYYRNAFWQKCRSSFLKGQTKDPFFQSDQTEVFSLVDHVFASNLSDEKFQIGNDQTKILQGLQGYIRSKLGKRPYEKENVDSLIEDTIEPACESIELRFKDLRELSEVIDDNQDFKNDLDEGSIKWLRALQVCNSINDNPELLDQGRSNLP